MGSLGRLLGLPQPEGYDAPETRSSTLASPSSLLVEALGVTPTFSGERVTVQKMMRDAAYSAIRKIAYSGVQLTPLKVYRRLENNDREEARAHRAWRMLHDKPNPHITANLFWSVVAVHLLAWENAFIRKVADEFGIVESLYLFDPERMRVEWNGLQKTYVETTPDGRLVRWSEDDVLHVIGFSTDGLAGVSRAKLCRETFATALARQRFEGAFYRQGAFPAGWIEYPGQLGEAGTDNLASAFRGKHGGARNAHKVPVLEEGAKFHREQMSMLDMQFVELRQQALTEIAVMFDLPPSYLGASTGDSLTYATAESNQIQFAQMAVAPLCNLIAQAVTYDPQILPQNIMYAEFSLEGLMRADMKTRAEYWTALKNLGVVDAAYIASRENLPAPPPEPPPPPPPPAANGNGNGNGSVDLGRLTHTTIRGG